MTEESLLQYCIMRFFTSFRMTFVYIIFLRTTIGRPHFLQNNYQLLIRRHKCAYCRGINCY